MAGSLIAIPMFGNAYCGSKAHHKLVYCECLHFEKQDLQIVLIVAELAVPVIVCQRGSGFC